MKLRLDSMNTIRNMMERVVAIGVGVGGAVIVKPDFNSGNARPLILILRPRLIVTEHMAFNYAVTARQDESGHAGKTVLERNGENRPQVRGAAAAGAQE